MNFRPILIVPGEQKSIFFEIFFKSIKSKKFISPLILICDKENLYREIIRFKFKKKIEVLSFNEICKKKLQNRKIYLINVSNKIPEFYVKRCFKKAFDLLRKGVTNKIINGPINKTKTLNKKFLGVTEYIANSFKKKKFAMLIFNPELSVCPVTTHLPLRLVKNHISKKILREFGFLISFTFPILIGWLLPAIRGHSFKIWTLWIGITSLSLAILRPTILLYPYRAWMKLGLILGWLNSRIIFCHCQSSI